MPLFIYIVQNTKNNTTNFMDPEFKLHKFCDYIHLHVQSDDNNSR